MWMEDDIIEDVLISGNIINSNATNNDYDCDTLNFFMLKGV
jgi:hypothetical protein